MRSPRWLPLQRTATRGTKPTSLRTRITWAYHQHVGWANKMLQGIEEQSKDRSHWMGRMGPSVRRVLVHLPAMSHVGSRLIPGRFMKLSLQC